MQITNRDKTILLMGVLGYSNLNGFDNNYKTSYALLKENDFNIEKIIDLHYDLKFDKDTETSFISLAGVYSTVKVKMSDTDKLCHYVAKHDVEISIG